MLGSVRAAEPLEIPLPPYIDAICIPVEIAGKERLFMLDSGASTLVFDASLKEHLGEVAGRYRMRDAAGQLVKMEFFRSPQMRIGETDWTCSDTVGCCDFSQIQDATGKEIEGILGAPFFATHIVQFDFDRRQLTVFPPGTPPQDEWGTPVQLRLKDDHLPMIPLTIPGAGLEWCVIDTGFNGSLALNWSTCLELEDDGAYSPLPDRLRRVLSGRQWARNGIVTKVSLQNFEHSNLAADCSKIFSHVGLHYLKRFRVTIDTGNLVGYFAKGQGFDDLEEPPLGFISNIHNGKIQMIGVQRSCPGEQAGLLENDELISANGKPVSGMSTNEIDWTIRQLSQKGTKLVILTIRRDGKVRDLQLDLSSIYD